MEEPVGVKEMASKQEQAAGYSAGHPDQAIRDFIDRFSLVSDPGRARFTPLTGGVSSDIWLVEEGERAFCVKQALARLRVAADWRAPVERNAYEAAWLKSAARLVPGSAPAIIAEDAAGGLFAMQFLPAKTHRLWKADLLAGRADPAFAAAVGRRLGKLHARFAREADAPSLFSTDASFHALRLEPYLVATAQAHADLAGPLHRLVARTAATKRTVVHGDVSPKNILIGPEGPVFLDAECAWFGDPAFDLAFCLNHLLLKCLAAPPATDALLDSFRQLGAAYLAEVDWEAPADVEGRAAALLAGLFLARIDGKSPVEYVTDEADKTHVRRVAGRLLLEPPSRLETVAAAWAHEIGAAQ